ADLDASTGPAKRAGGAEEPRVWSRGRLVALVAAAAALALIAGPLEAPGLALVLGALALPLLLATPEIAIAAPLTAPLLGGVGAGAAAAGLGAFGARAGSRALLGAASWLWLACGAIALGAGPLLAPAFRAEQGWAQDADLAARQVLAP